MSNDAAIERIVNSLIAVEGGYSNDPTDAGGETNYGITIATARRNGYHGPMRDMPIKIAQSIYKNEYITKYGFERIVEISELIGHEVIDTGVNMGVEWAGKFLQRAINLFGDFNLVVDGNAGPRTTHCLSLVLKQGKSREQALAKALNCLQGSRYIGIAESNPSQKKFIVGWLNNRVTM